MARGKYANKHRNRLGLPPIVRNKAPGFKKQPRNRGKRAKQPDTVTLTGRVPSDPDPMTVVLKVQKHR